MGGVSSARNVGMDKAQGEWIVFVDPDDRLEPFYLQALHDAVAESGLPLAIGGFKEYYAGQDVWCDHTLKDVPKSMPLKECYFRFNLEQISAPWNKVYNTDFLRKHGLHFDEIKSVYEDRFFNFQIFALIEEVALVADSGYRYIRNASSAMQKYHANFVETQEEVDAAENRLLLKFGKTEEELETRYVKSAAFNVYIYVINYFKLGNGLSFRQKAARIREEILGDGHLMGALRTHRLRWEGPNVTMCTHLVLTRQAWMVAAVFQLLFFLKNHFMGLFCWYDTHLSGKLKK